MKLRYGFVSNSSSSSFICDTNLTLDEVKEKLVKMVDFYNDIFGFDTSFSSIFKSPTLVDDEFIDNALKYLGNNQHIIKKVIGKQGKVLINSASDNSIPYFMIILIETLFNTNVIRCDF